MHETRQQLNNAKWDLNIAMDNEDNWVYYELSYDAHLLTACLSSIISPTLNPI